MSSIKRLISIVTPAFNERDCVEPLYEQIVRVMTPVADRYDFELIFVDDGSTDGTIERLRKLVAQDKRVRVFRLSRNFGFQRALALGYRKSRGDAAVEIDCDLQDPPELILDFIRRWEEGYAVVYGIRRKRQEGPLINLARRVGYRIIALLSRDELPADAGDFRLIDRRVMDELNPHEDPSPYLRGTIAAMGFRQTGIPYDRHARTRGQSKFPFFKLVGLAANGILNHSIIPLRIASYMGLVTSFIMFIGFLIYFIGRVFFGRNWPAGFATTTTLLLFSLSVNSLFLGIIGEYLGRIYQHLKKQSLPIIEEEIEASPIE